MAYLALYRTWRPQTFHDMIGQQHVTRTLQNALKRQRFAHAYLFNGPRGTGKTSAAKILAKAVNCKEGPSDEPCNECEICKGITEGSVVDVVEIDAASNRGVEEIRDLREKIKYAPTEARYKVYIIDEVHMLTTEAFNALLKTLEEPPENVLFILATTEPHKLPLTIISRCQRFDFRRISTYDIVERLRLICEANHIQADQNALALIARVAEGGLRDALSLLDQVLSYGESVITMEDVSAVTGAVSQTYLSRIVRYIYDKDITNLLDLMDELMVAGKDPQRLLEDLIHYYRDLLLYQSVPELSDLKERLLLDENFQQLSNDFAREDLYDIISRLSESQSEIKWGNQQRIMLEVCLIQLSHNDRTANGAEGKTSQNVQEQIQPLLKRVKMLEMKLENLLSNEESSMGDMKPKEKSEKLPKKPFSNEKTAVERRVQDIILSGTAEQFHHICGKWNEILQYIKEQKIQVHAWFMNGKPVAASKDTVVVAFKHSIHRETMEKPSHRQLVEDSMQFVLGEQVQLLTILEDRWNEIAQIGLDSMEADDEDRSKDPFIEEAIKLVGKELVEFKD